MNQRFVIVAVTAFVASLVSGGLATHTWLVPDELVNARNEIAVLYDLVAKQQAMISEINAVIGEPGAASD